MNELKDFTTLPWAYRSGQIVTKDGSAYIANVHTDAPIGGYEKDCNGKLIVRAVNTFEPMRKLLQDISHEDSLSPQLFGRISKLLSEIDTIAR